MWPLPEEKIHRFHGKEFLSCWSMFWTSLVHRESGPSSLWIIHISSIFWRGVKLPFWHVCGFWRMCSHLIITRWWTRERECNCLQIKVFVSPGRHDFRTGWVPLWPTTKVKKNSGGKEDNHSFPFPLTFRANTLFSNICLN